MAKDSIGNTYQKLLREINAGEFRPVYYLIGEEPYFIDVLSSLLAKKVLSEDERDFNQITLFGPDVDAAAVVNAARSFPMGANRLVVIVKEAQHIKDVDKLTYYLQAPQPTTVLVICHKNTIPDRRKKLFTLADKVGVLFESKKYKDYQLSEFICQYLAGHQMKIEDSASTILGDLVGTDLSRLTGELEKLILSVPRGKNLITRGMVEANIGLSKEFNYFELQTAIVNGDILKANRIVQYFGLNPKANPLQLTLIMLFKFFSKLMLAYYAPDKSSVAMASWVGMSEWQVRENILPGMKIFSGVKVMKIIAEIRKTDAYSKGVGCPVTGESDLLRDLIFFIFH